MKIRKHKLALAFVVMVTSLMALAGYQAFALNRLAQLEPAVVATVDLQRVFDSVEEGAAAIKELEAELQALIDEEGRRADEIRSLEADLEDFAPGTTEYRNAEQRYIQESIRFEAWTQFASQKMNLLRGEAMRELYLSIKQQAAELARQHGYDLVLVDDELAEFIPGTETEIMRQIASRRMLYSTQTIDITDELIATMNASNAGG